MKFNTHTQKTAVKSHFFPRLGQIRRCCTNMASKRKPMYDETTPTKRFKLTDPNAIEIDESPTLIANVAPFDGIAIQLNDLNMDCLEHIFDYLRPIDILNIATINDTFATVAQIPFKRVFGEQELVINPFEANIDGLAIEFYRFIEFLHTFGRNITKIRIESNMVELSWHLISSTLVNVTDVTFAHCRLEMQMSQFNVWFPKMKRLNLINVHVSNGKCIEMHFPLLEELTIKLSRAPQMPDNQLTANNVRHVLYNNPQIKLLDLNAPFGSDLLFEINKWCPGIERLTLTCDTKVPINLTDANPLPAEQIFQNVKFLNLGLLNWPIGTLAEQYPSFNLGQMCKFIHFILRRNLIENILIPANDLHDGILIRLTELFPNVEEVELSGDLHLFSGCGLTAFMGQLRQLTEIRFELMDADIFHALKQSIDRSEWNTNVAKDSIAHVITDGAVAAFENVVVKRVT